MTRLCLIVLLMTLPVIAMANTSGAETVSDTCGAAGFAGLIGQSGEIARMLELETAIRVIPPGSAVTRDYRLERINFDLNDAGTIIRIWCG